MTAAFRLRGSERPLSNYQNRRWSSVRDRLTDASERPESPQSTAPHNEKVGLGHPGREPFQRRQSASDLLDSVIQVGPGRIRHDGAIAYVQNAEGHSDAAGEATAALERLQ